MTRNNGQRDRLKTIAQGTVSALDRGYYVVGSSPSGNGEGSGGPGDHNNELHCNISRAIEDCVRGTRYFPPDAQIAFSSSRHNAYSSRSRPHHVVSGNRVDVGPAVLGESVPLRNLTRCRIQILEMSTIEGARLLAASPSFVSAPQPGVPPSSSYEPSSLGILNFASAKRPGGGFLSGASAQEESLARVSTLYPSLMSRTASPFYDSHRYDPRGGYYTHAMIFSPNVVIFRGEGAWARPTTPSDATFHNLTANPSESTQIDGSWLPPSALIYASIVTSPAVNATSVKQTLHSLIHPKPQLALKIEKVMRERMTRILKIFEASGTTHLVLGSFGTGVFGNDVATVSQIWADLLAGDDAPFSHSFTEVVFAILGQETFQTFEAHFEARASGGLYKG